MDNIILQVFSCLTSELTYNSKYLILILYSKKSLKNYKTDFKVKMEFSVGKYY